GEVNILRRLGGWTFLIRSCCSGNILPRQQSTNNSQEHQTREEEAKGGIHGHHLLEQSNPHHPAAPTRENSSCRRRGMVNQELVHLLGASTPCNFSVDTVFVLRSTTRMRWALVSAT